MSAAIFPAAPVHNGQFVPIIRSSGRLLMSRCMWGERYTAAFWLWNCLAFYLPVRSHFPWRPQARRTATLLHAGPIICLLWSAACPPFQPALAPFSRVRTPLSWPMFTVLLSTPQINGEMVSNGAQIPPRCQRRSPRAVICWFTLDRGFQRGKLNMFKAINVISSA